LVKVPVGYKLPCWLVVWLRQQDRPAALMIEEALMQRYKIKHPSQEERK
jgi:hypothetical protein